jgi:GT2 family glycosyltransferase
MLCANQSPIERVTFVSCADAVRVAREEMERRGDRYVALVDARTHLQPGWLDELIAQIEFSRNTAAATYAPELPLGRDVPTFTADARCTLLALRKFPQHLRLDDFPTLDGAVADLLVRAVAVRAGVRQSSKALGELPAVSNDAAFEQRHGLKLREALSPDPVLVERAIRTAPGRRPGLVSIVMLSWNAPEYTKLALESIRRHTDGEYEVVIVDNGSKAETVEWLRTLQDVRVIYNESNRGYAGGNNQAIAAARGEYVVLLNNDVVVTEGWLDGLLGAFDRIPGLGVSAPRSNRIAGDQVTVDSDYANLEAMQAYAALRRRRFRGEGYLTDRAIGLCLCIDRRVIQEIGGIDERFGAGNFEDDDFSLRGRGAGYRIFVCDDVFIHHFGSQTFAANNVDWSATMRENWKKFARKWGFPETYPENGYVTTDVIRRGFDRGLHYVPIARSVALAFTACVQDERDWSEVGAFVRRYAQAFNAQDPTVLRIRATGMLAASTLGARVEKILERLEIDPRGAAAVDVLDASGTASLAASRTVELASLEQRSPSALRSLLEEATP